MARLEKFEALVVPQPGGFAVQVVHRRTSSGSPIDAWRADLRQSPMCINGHPRNLTRTLPAGQRLERSRKNADIAYENV